MKIRQAEAEALWIRAVFGLQEESALQEMQDLLAFFEPDYPESFVVFGLLWSLAAHCRKIADYEQAIFYGKRCLNVSIGWQDLGWISIAETNLARTYLQMGRTDLASRLVLEELEWHLAIGQIWQTLGNLGGISAGFSLLLDSNETAVSVMSVVYHHPESSVKYWQDIERARPLFEEKMGAAAYATAWEKGKELDFETAVALMKVALTQNYPGNSEFPG
jgi:hypothetical protein